MGLAPNTRSQLRKGVSTICEKEETKAGLSSDVLRPEEPSSGDLENAAGDYANFHK